MQELERLVQKQKLRNVLTMVYELGAGNEAGERKFEVVIARAVKDISGQWQPCGAPTEADRLDLEEAECLGEEWVIVD